MPAPDNLNIQTPGEPITQTTTEQQTNNDQHAEPEYTAKHNGGGRWRIYSTSKDDWFSDFVVSGEGAKALAEQEADRLNAGGEPFTKPTESQQEAATVQAAATQTTTEQQAPRTSAVLTDEGWLVPDLPSRKE